MRLQTYQFQGQLLQALLINGRLGVIIQDLGRILRLPPKGPDLLSRIFDLGHFSEGHHYDRLSRKQFERFGALQAAHWLTNDHGVENTPFGAITAPQFETANASIIYNEGLIGLLGIGAPDLDGDSHQVQIPAWLNVGIMSNFNQFWGQVVLRDIVWNGDEEGGEQSPPIDPTRFPEEMAAPLPCLDDYSIYDYADGSPAALERIGDKLLDTGAKQEGVDVLVAAAQLLAHEGDIQRRRSRDVVGDMFSRLSKKDRRRLVASLKRMRDMQDELRKAKDGGAEADEGKDRREALRRAMAGEDEGGKTPKIAKGACPLPGQHGMASGLGFFLSALLKDWDPVGEGTQGQSGVTSDQDILVALAVN